MAEPKEGNSLNHVGVKPAVDQDSIRTYPRLMDDLTQIYDYDTVENNTLTFYTVTAGKTLNLITCNILIYNTSGGAGTSWLRIHNDSGGTTSYLAYTVFTGDGNDHYEISYPIPLLVPAGYYFRAYSSVAGLFLRSAIHGFEV